MLDEDLRRHPKHIHTAGGAQGMLIGDAGSIAPVVLDFVQAEQIAGAQIAHRAMTVIDPLADPGKARPHHDQIVGDLVLGDDNRFVVEALDALFLRHRLVSGVPIEFAVARELGAARDLADLLGAQILEQRRFAELHFETVLAIQLIDLVAERGVAPSDVAQTLPANFQQLRVGFRKYGGGSGAARDRGNFAEHLARADLDREMIADNRKRIAQG